MNYYDEEMRVESNDIKPSGFMKVERVSRSRNGGGLYTNAQKPGSGGNSSSGMTPNRPAITKRQNTLFRGNSTDDDGLLQDIIDHDEDDEDDSEIEDIMDLPTTNPMTDRRDKSVLNQSTLKRGLRTSANSQQKDVTDSESEEGLSLEQASNSDHTLNSNKHLNITAEKWQKLSIAQEIKDIFPYILKYTPQHIETVYHLKPFLPDYVPAVGDVDAFLKVTTPSPVGSIELQDHLAKVGLHLLDEPSGSQTEPSLLNIKLRSVLTGNSAKAQKASIALVPTARTPKDIDKWIAEVDHIHMSQSVYDAPLRKDMDRMLMEWPRSYATVTTDDAYHRCLTGDLSLSEYIRSLCHDFNIEGPLETQTDYLLSVQTLFALYLAANQAWE